MSDLRNDYLAAYRRSVQTPDGVREANLQAVLERAAAIEAQPAPARWAASALLVKLTTVVVLSAGLGWGLVAATSSQAPEDPVRVATTVAPPPAVAPAPRQPVVTPTPDAPEMPEASSSRAVTPARPRREPEPAPEANDTLREELALLEAARIHLRAGRLRLAERALSKHARRFPQGTLAIERSAWKAIVSCSGGGAQPQASARTFILTHGDTPLAAKVKAECGL